MSAPPYMKLWISDYHGDTTHLDCREHGAYLLLLMAMWRAGGKLPADDVKLSKLAKLPADQWAEVRDTVLAFFRRRGAWLTHKRVAQEIAKYETVSERRKAAGKAGGAKTANKNNGQAEANAADLLGHLPTKPEPEPEPELREEPTSYERAPDWRQMFAEAKEAAGDMADLTRPAMHHVADLRALVEPASGEPCTWDEVLTAIRMVAMRQRAKGKLIASWSWVKADAVALRDKRLNAANPEVAEVVPFRGAGPPPTSLTDRMADERRRAEALAFEMLDAQDGRTN